MIIVFYYIKYFILIYKYKNVYKLILNDLKSKFNYILNFLKFI